MKNLILILVAILTSTIITSQVRFNYMRWLEDEIKADSTGYMYYTSDPDTVVTIAKKFPATIVYHFDNEGETLRVIPIYRTKVKTKEVIHFGKWGNKFYKITYNKKYGDFIMKERALFSKNGYTLYFHRDYDYYDQLTSK